MERAKSSTVKYDNSGDPRWAPFTSYLLGVGGFLFVAASAWLGLAAFRII